jgi:DNA invertase Pin-like site-specific DNA recombinase
MRLRMLFNITRYLSVNGRFLADTKTKGKPMKKGNLDHRSCQSNPDLKKLTQNENQLVGYARVSTNDQDLQLQLDALREHGCTKIFTDKASGAKDDRKGLNECLQYLFASPGKTLVVWRIDRLGRSLSHLVSIITSLQEHQTNFRSLMDGALDTTSPTGQFVFHIFCALAQMEAGLIASRTQAGLKAARARGRFGGRPKTSVHDPLVLAVKRMYQDGVEIKHICEKLKLSESTVYRYNRLEDDK